MEDSVFTKIIKGEVPSYKIYEDDKALAFLNISPDEEGHTLVIPKKQVDKIYNLEDKEYIALWQAAKKVAKHLEEVTGFRSTFHIVGVDVPHAHIHIVPYDPDNHKDDAEKMASKAQATPEDLAETASRLKMQ